METDIPKTSEAAGMPSNDWEATAERLFNCSAELERENVRLKNIEDAARQWWKASGRYNSQIAACKLGEALGHKVTWPEGYNPANDPHRQQPGTDVGTK